MVPTPLTIHSRPKPLVSLSKPILSQMMMDESDTKPAEWRKREGAVVSIGVKV